MAAGAEEKVEDTTELIPTKDGEAVLAALRGARRHAFIAADTQDATTIEIIRSALVTAEAARHWDELPLVAQYDAQRQLSAIMEDLLWRGWRLSCAVRLRKRPNAQPQKLKGTILIIDEKPAAREVLADPRAIEEHAAEFGVSRDDMVEFLTRIVDGERITLLAEIAKRLGVSPEALSNAIRSLHPDGLSESADRAAETLGVAPEALLQAANQLLRCALEHTRFLEQHGLQKKRIRQPTPAVSASGALREP